MTADTPHKYAFKLVTPDGIVFQDDVLSVVFTAADGRMGVLNRHQPFLILMKPCVLKISVAHREFWFAVKEGVGQMDSSNQLILLSDGAQACDTPHEAQRLVATFERQASYVTQ